MTCSIMKLHMKNKRQKSLKPTKQYLIYGAIGLILCSGIAVFAFLSHRPVQNTNTTTAPSSQASNDSTLNNTADTVPETAENDTSAQSQASPPASPTPTPTPKTTPVPFQISKVYFSEAPVTPPEAAFNACSLGQNITYTGTADITAAAPGTATYHWSIGDHARGESKNYEDQTITFASAGTKKVSRTFTYIVSDLASYYGLSGTKFYNRQYLNVFVTAPNTTYANIGSPVYGAGSFIWGTYVDLC